MRRCTFLPGVVSVLNIYATVSRAEINRLAASCGQREVEPPRLCGATADVYAVIRLSMMM